MSDWNIFMLGALVGAIVVIVVGWGIIDVMYTLVPNTMIQRVR